ncbi:MAG: hypothetical protein OXT65_00220, partial [Alphaproteobacteria bacterium]|nr:hypothetical protein [Alphaproteobacteria bacterium]
MHRLVLLLFLVTAIPPTLAADMPPLPATPLDCAETGIMAKRLMAKERLAYLADAIDENGVVHMWYISPKTGEWAELTIDDNQN